MKNGPATTHGAAFGFHGRIVPELPKGSSTPKAGRWESGGFNRNMAASLSRGRVWCIPTLKKPLQDNPRGNVPDGLSAGSILAGAILLPPSGERFWPMVTSS